MRALLLALLLASSAGASDMNQPGVGPGTAVAASTLTISGAGTACFTAGALSINCASGSITGSSATFNDLRLTYGLTASTAVITYVQASSITTTMINPVLGNLGIGTASPGGKLEIKSSQANENTSYVLRVSSQNGSVMAAVDGSGALTLGFNGATPLFYRPLVINGGSSNDLGILMSHAFGTGWDHYLMATSGNLAWSKDGRTTAVMKLSSDNGALALTNGITLSSVTASGGATFVGNVGIGTTNDPATKLHMSSGTLTVDGTGAEIKTTGTAVIASSTQVNGTLSVGEGTTADTVSGGSRMRIYDQTKPGLQIDGFSNTGASVLGGEIRLGSSGSYHGKLSFNGADAHMNIVNTYDAADSRVQFVSRHTRVNASTATFANGVLSIAAPATVAAGFQPPIRTKAQIDALTPTSEGQIIICSNCSAPYAMCVSTGTNLSAYRRSDSTTIGCGTNN